MTDRLPSGTRDVLPMEMRELRAMTDRIREVFQDAEYGEVYTPALEYESTFDRAALAGSVPAYRMFDEHGAVLVLRSDMTVPIARVVANRYQHAEGPLRFSYFAHAYRSVRPQRGHSREFLQAGVELIGAGAPDGTAEALTILCRALDAAGLKTYSIGLGDVSLYPALMAALSVPDAAREAILARLAVGDFVAVQSAVDALGLPAADAQLLARVPQMRGGPEILADLVEPLKSAVAGMVEVHERLAPEVAERVIFDFGLVKKLGYYTGAVFQVYDPAHGEPLGGGGRYDELLGLFGHEMPAVGFALNVEQLHIALTEEERGER